MKYIRTLMLDGSEWDVPAYVVAGHYANTQMALKEQSGLSVFEDYFNGAFTNDTLLVAHSRTMEWDYVLDVTLTVNKIAKHARKAEIESYHQDWQTGEKSIIEK